MEEIPIFESKPLDKKTEPNTSSTSTPTNPEMNLKYPKIYRKELNPEEIYIGKRIELQEYIGTIKYIGPLLHKECPPSEIWLGIEWDDESRGKHNGTVEGKKYFETSKGLNNGSLIKLSKVNIGQKFSEAVDYKYNFYSLEGNEIHQFVDKTIETDNFIQANKKKINIELVGKEKAITEFAQTSRMVCVDLNHCLIRGFDNNISTIFPNLEEISITSTLIDKWSKILFLLKEFPNLSMINLSENVFSFDDEFEQKIKEINTDDKNKLKLEVLVLNKSKLDFYSLIKISPLFKTVDKLYLMGNNLNKETYEKTEENKMKFIKENISVLQENVKQLHLLSVEKNKVESIYFIFKMFAFKEIHYLNLNQNKITQIIDDGLTKEEKEFFIDNFKKSINHLLIDYNMFNVDNFTKIIRELEIFDLKNIDILNNTFIEKGGFEKAKTELIGRNPNLNILNGTTITKFMRKEYEKFYLKNSVQAYFDNFYHGKDLKEEGNVNGFNFEKFEEYMKENNPQYFNLRTKYFDPLEDFVNLTQKKKTHTIKGNISEVVFRYGDKDIKKKLPKTTMINGLRNLCTKLFKMDSSFIFSFYIYNENDKSENLIEDESLRLMDLDLKEENKIILK